MRRKKHKQTRRATNYYRINYGFHEPYKVLLDGNFIHATQAINMPDLATHVPRLLGGTCKLYTTRCVSRELRSLGHEYAAAAGAARSLVLHKCGHEGAAGGALPAAECLRATIGGRNEGHWWVATQDTSLRVALGKVPGCPLLFATVNGIHLETPSEVSKKHAKEEEAATQKVHAHERAAEPLLAEAPHAQLHTSVRFRRNKARGPNPLSIKKKTKTQPRPAQQPGPSAAAEQQQQQQQEQGGRQAEGRQHEAAPAGGKRPRAEAGAAGAPRAGAGGGRKGAAGAQGAAVGAGEGGDGQPAKRRRKRAAGSAAGGGEAAE